MTDAVTIIRAILVMGVGHKVWIENMTLISKQAAPGDLEVVRQFVNSNDIEGGRDAFDSPEGMRAWLSEHGLLPADASISDAERQRVVAVREALRALLLANNEAPPDHQAVVVLSEAGRTICLQIVFDSESGARLVPAQPGVDAVLGRLLAVIYHAMAVGSWSRLKACRSHTCQWAFYDHSRNQSATWCTMSVCGSRNKARAYRQRQRNQT